MFFFFYDDSAENRDLDKWFVALPNSFLKTQVSRWTTHTLLKKNSRDCSNETIWNQKQWRLSYKNNIRNVSKSYFDYLQSNDFEFLNSQIKHYKLIVYRSWWSYFCIYQLYHKNKLESKGGPTFWMNRKTCKYVYILVTGYLPNKIS